MSFAHNSQARHIPSYAAIPAALVSLASLVPAYGQLSWTLRNPYPTASDLFAITSMNGMYAATGANGEVITAADSAPWTEQNSGQPGELIASIAADGRTLVAVGQNRLTKA